MSDNGRQVFRDDIANAIRKAIFSGELRPGDRIKELHWAEQLGVSQGPVREALRDLEAQGLVETVPFKGSHVREMSQKDISDNYIVRMCLEDKSLKIVTEKLSDDELAGLCSTLEGIVANMDACAEKEDLIGFTQCDTNFHQQIIICTGNEVLLRLWLQCNMRNWFVVTPQLMKADVLKELQLGHKAITKALSERDYTSASALLDDHLVTLMNKFIEKI